MNLKSMKLPPREKTSEEKMYPTMATDKPEYPYGLELSLDHDQLKSLGIDKLPDVGSALKLEAKGHVSSTHSSEGADGEHRNVRVQITHLGMGDCEDET